MQPKKTMVSERDHRNSRKMQCLRLEGDTKAVFRGGEFEQGLPRRATGLKKKTKLPMKVDFRDTGLIPGSGRSPEGGGHGNLLQYSCLENPRGQRSLRGLLWTVGYSL